jgi:hypothetical protein
MAKKSNATQNDAKANTAEPSKLDASETNEELAQKVIDGVRLAKLTAEDMLELRNRFAKLKKNEDILTYRRNEWERFCKEKLGMSPQTARRWIRETCKAIGKATPGSKHDGSKNRTGALPPWSVKTPDGTPVDVARSAAQKAVRDGDEQAGIYWIKQLYFADRKVWKALSIFAVEEIGIADLSVKTHVVELEKLAEACKDERNSDLLHVITAMTICCRAKKCRAADDAAIWYNEHPTYTMPTPQEVKDLANTNLPQPTIDDKVFDRHTTKGRKMGRGMQHFKQAASQLNNKSNVVPFVPPSDKRCPHCGGTGKVAA